MRWRNDGISSSLPSSSLFFSSLAFSTTFLCCLSFSRTSNTGRERERKREKEWHKRCGKRDEKHKLFCLRNQKESWLKNKGKNAIEEYKPTKVMCMCTKTCEVKGKSTQRRDCSLSLYLLVFFTTWERRKTVMSREETNEFLFMSLENWAVKTCEKEEDKNSFLLQSS